MKYKQGYEDQEQDNEPMYPLDDYVDMVLENVEEQASRDEEGSGEYEDAKKAEEGEEKV